jgi:hypothetical protein
MLDFNSPDLLDRAWPTRFPKPLAFRLTTLLDDSDG